MIACVRADRLPVVGHGPFVLSPGNPIVEAGMWCPGCDEPLAGGQACVLVVVGPGPDPDKQQAARQGRWHTAAAVTVHAACAGMEDA